MPITETCTHVVGEQHVNPTLCGKPAVWKVWFNDGWEKSTTEVCDAHLVDAQEVDDYVGATAL